MTPADERIVQLLAKWRRSLDLHGRYVRLSDDQYWLVQPWPDHQRPTPWIVDLASQRLSDLQRIVQSRIAAADPSLSEALELMAFLANLVGSQHVQRYIPMAEPEQQRPIESLLAPEDSTTTTHALRLDVLPEAQDTGTVEMPVAGQAGDTAGAAPSQEPPDEDAEVVRDAIRLVSWGRPWHELPAAIARMAGRPKAARIRQILKDRREEIEAQAANQPKRR